MFDDTAELRTTAATASFEQRWPEALTLWRTVLIRHPDNVEAYNQAGQAALAVGDLSAAEELLAEAVRRGANDVSAWLNYAEVAARAEQAEEAGRRFTAACDAFPESAAAVDRYAAAKIKFGDFDGADALLEMGVRRFPTYVWLRLQHATVASRTERWDVAIDRWANFRRDFPHMPDGWLDGALVLVRLGRGQEISALLDQALLLESANIWHHLSAIQLGLGQGEIKVSANRWLSALSRFMPSAHEQRALYNVGCDVFARALENDQTADVAELLWVKLLLQPEDDSPDYVPAILRQTLPLYFHSPKTFAALKRFAAQRPSTEREPSNEVNFDRVRFAFQLLTDPSAREAYAEHYILHASFKLLSCLFDRWLMPDNVETLHRLLPKLANDPSLSDRSRFNLAIGAATGNGSVLTSLWERAASVHDEHSPDGPGAVLSAAGRRRRSALASVSSSSPVNRRLQIALCVSGQLRGYREAKQTWGPLGLASHDVDIFVDVWANVGRKLPVPPHCARAFEGFFLERFEQGFRAVGRDEMERSYPHLFAWFRATSIVTVDQLAETYNTDYINIQNDEDAPYNGMANHEKMYYKVESAWNYLIKTGKSYDLVIRIRPDKSFFRSPTLNLYDVFDKCTRDRKILADGGAFLHYDVRLGMGDQFAVGTYEAMSCYSRAYSITRDRLQQPAFDYPADLLSHETFAAVAFYNGIHVDNLPHVAFGPPLDPSRISQSALKRLLTTDVSVRRPTSLDRDLLSAVEKDRALSKFATIRRSIPRMASRILRGWGF
ncbi:tetratricopeptide repeat protein [Methylobacterium sp. E-005]|uniref:tetratricopeptide repeat protein n=1 Tax=Methylobacterium sp. E-005 TaxID=2836549 RepID=UPI001FBBD6D0|nr:tetratricopeptide repeat protein [Methylobacterium sp. E-005]MCJ2087482.1 tetratricopeptide repeat protein [Methylobacterium sp. E-005]